MAAQLDPQRWDLISALFHQALELTPVERVGFLERSCGADPMLHREVAAMLAAHSEEPTLAIEERLFSDGEAARAATAELPPGTRLGAYRIDALIGQGGMGEVYRAERVDGEFRQTVALKLLRPGYRTAETVRRFRLEREVLARLVHPGIVAILDGGTATDGRPYLVLQFVDGIPVTRYCSEQGLDLEARLRLFLRIAEAVQFAHGRLVVHRDLKPSNILVQPDGTPRLLDFGIAKLLDRAPEGSGTVATEPDVRLLTPEHAAPEQLRGEAVGTAADVYGLGGLLFLLLTGRRPFEAVGRTGAELERAILTEPPPAPSSVAERPADRRKLRGDLDRIVLMALRKEPERRYQSAGQLAEDVERYLDGLPVRAQPDTLRYRTGKFVARNRGAVAAAVILVLLLAGFSASTLVQSRRIAGERDRAERERAGAEDVVTILTDLFQRTNPRLVAGGDTLRAVALIDDAERRVAALDSQPDRQARLWRALGNLHLARGRNERAKTLLLQSWQRQRALYGDEDVETARAYHQAALAVWAYDGDAAARPMFDASVTRLRRLLGEENREVAEGLLDLAMATVDPAENSRLLDQVVALRRRLPDGDSIAIASLFNAQGTARFGRGQFREALGLFGASLRILSARLAPENPDRLDMMRNVASALAQLGEWARAESVVVATVAAGGGMERARPGDIERLALFAAHQGRLEEAETRERTALAMYRAASAPNHSLIDNALRNLGIIVAARGRVTEGLALLDSAVARRRRSGSAPGYMIAQRAPLLLRLGRIPEAARAVAEGDSLLRRSSPAGAVQLADLDHWAAMVALAQGDPRAAVERLGAATELFTELLPATHPKLAAARCALGVALSRRGRASAAEAHSLLSTACPIHAQWGLADPLLREWGERVAR